LNRDWAIIFRFGNVRGAGNIKGQDIIEDLGLISPV